MWMHPSQCRPKEGGHRCELNTDEAGAGAAVDACYEDEQGRYWVENGEYASMVHFCPVCGKKAGS